MRLKNIARALALAAVIGSVPPVAADSGVGDGYAAPNYMELTQTMVMLGGIDVNSNLAIDEYIRVLYCSIYQEKFTHDFEWDNIRKSTRIRIQEKRDNYRVFYELSGPVTLERYDFEEGVFPLTKSSKLSNVGSLTVLNLSVSETCSTEHARDLAVLPYIYHFHLDRPLNIEKIKIAPDMAKAMLDYMQTHNYETRQLYLRFRVRVSEALGITGERRQRRGIMRAQLESIDVFLDDRFTLLLARIPLM